MPLLVALKRLRQRPLIATPIRLLCRETKAEQAGETTGAGELGTMPEPRRGPTMPTWRRSAAVFRPSECRFVWIDQS